MKHLKRLAAPATWNVKRKSTKFIARPNPCGHPLDMAIPLIVFMREIGSYAKTTKEVKTIIREKHILVNGRRRYDYRDAAGFLDVIEMGDPQETVRIIVDKRGKISYVKIPIKEAEIKICKVIGKRAMKGNKLQMNLSDGQNFLINPKDREKINDSVVVNIKSNKIIEHLPFEKNATVFFREGKQIGQMGKVIEVDKENVTVKLQSGMEYKTKKSYAFVVGKEHPIITIQSE